MSLWIADLLENFFEFNSIKIINYVFVIGFYTDEILSNRVRLDIRTFECQHEGLLDLFRWENLKAPVPKAIRLRPLANLQLAKDESSISHLPK